MLATFSEIPPQPTVNPWSPEAPLISLSLWSQFDIFRKVVRTPLYSLSIWVEFFIFVPGFWYSLF